MAKAILPTVEPTRVNNRQFTPHNSISPANECTGLRNIKVNTVLAMVTATKTGRTTRQFTIENTTLKKPGFIVACGGNAGVPAASPTPPGSA